MPLRLYADECVDARVVAGLRRRGVNITTAGDQGLLGRPDEHHLLRAAELGRIVVTCDGDFLRLVRERTERRERHDGLIFILPRTTVGDAVRAIALAAEVLDPPDMADWIEWVP